MVVNVAQAGRGSYSMILNDNQGSELNSKVITALAQAFEPSLKGCKLVFGGQEEQLNEVFRNETLYRSRIMSKEEFAKMTFEFSSEEDPVTKQAINFKFSSDEFRQVEDEAMAKAIFKSAANSEMSKVKGSTKEKDMSIKYQVLSG